MHWQTLAMAWHCQMVHCHGLEGHQGVPGVSANHSLTVQHAPVAQLVRLECSGDTA